MKSVFRRKCELFPSFGSLFVIPFVDHYFPRDHCQVDVHLITLLSKYQQNLCLKNVDAGHTGLLLVQDWKLWSLIRANVDILILQSKMRLQGTAELQFIIS